VTISWSTRLYAPVMRNSERRELTTQKVIDASLVVLQEVGYARLRTADVSKRTDLSEGALFRYFSTKIELVAAALEQALARHLQRLADQFAALDGNVTRKTGLQLVWDVMAHPELAWTYEVYGAAAHDPALAVALRPVMLTHSTDIESVAAAVVQEQAGVPAADVAKVVNLLAWVMQGLVLSDLGRGTTGRQGELLEYLEFLAETAYPIVPPAKTANASKKAAVTKLAAKKPAPTKPFAEKPTTKSAAKKPATKKPTTKKPTTKSPVKKSASRVKQTAKKRK
jgi:AcrR family transcriptional regulator